MMRFRSKAQMRAMFARSPVAARKIAHAQKAAQGKNWYKRLPRGKGYGAGNPKRRRGGKKR